LVRYFGDDERYDLKQMYEQEKMNTAEDQNSMLSSLAGQFTLLTIHSTPGLGLDTKRKEEASEKGLS
jgi:hypothetical protein